MMHVAYVMEMILHVLTVQMFQTVIVGQVTVAVLLQTILVMTVMTVLVLQMVIVG